MDRFDRIAIATVFALAIGTAVLMLGRREEPGRTAPQRGMAAEPAPASAELDANLKILRNLLDAGNLAEAEPLAQDLARRYPFQAEAQMLLGDLFMRKQDPVQAMHAYKKAIEYNPDYLDKKTPQFQGKKLKVAVGEALAEIESRLKKNPEDETLKAEKKTVYYLYRKIAGSCG
ncbi:MAG: tetratricopeptide repeat protein [Nitrospiraceae bacterium]|nr:tetratricopeptide repeat protein [Nitrospiraceae bacterium]